ncbi:MAG: rhodanese-like domain-containing protein [Helicobacter sp.]|nr:rhodanese-like domain-containing protein [Helicobacter sp.]
MEYYGKRHKSLAKAIFKEELDEICGSSEWICVDIRNPEDFASGHLKGARNVITREELQEVLDQGKKVLLNCYSGHTVSLLGSQLVDDGYTNIYFLDEEISDCL